MLKYPVDVKKTKEGQYEARLTDMTNGPCGLGEDPYSAFEDLTKGAKKALLLSLRNNLLPQPSEIEDRPVINFNPEEERSIENNFQKPINTDYQNSFVQMANYSWTNHEFI